MEKDKTEKKKNLTDEIFENIFKFLEQKPEPKPQGHSTSITTVNISICVQPQRKGFFKWLLGLFW